MRSRNRRKLNLEHFHQICSGELKADWTAVFLVFGFVSAQLQVVSNLRLRRSLAKNQKILAAHRYIFSVNALVVNRLHGGRISIFEHLSERISKGIPIANAKNVIASRKDAPMIQRFQR
jgi:hypothetical protein